MENEIIKKVWFLIIRSSTENLKEIPLIPGRNTIGREADNDIVIHDVAASGHHAEIYFDQISNTVSVRDLESTNGTFVNGKRIQEARILQQDDQIRVGHFFISIIHTEKRSSHSSPVSYAPTKVTGELILESVDQYGVLLHEIGQRLVNIPDLDTALIEISALIKRMIGAEECQVLMEDEFEDLSRLRISNTVAQKIIENKSALIFSDSLDEFSKHKETITQPLQSMLLVPVMID